MSLNYDPAAGGSKAVAPLLAPDCVFKGGNMPQAGPPGLHGAPLPLSRHVPTCLPLPSAPGPRAWPEGRVWRTRAVCAQPAMQTTGAARPQASAPSPSLRPHPQAQVNSCAMWSDVMASLLSLAPDFNFTTQEVFAKDDMVAGAARICCGPGCGPTPPGAALATPAGCWLHARGARLRAGLQLGRGAQAARHTCCSTFPVPGRSGVHRERHLHPGGVPG